MNTELSLFNGIPLEFKKGLPPDYTGPLLHGAAALSAKTNLTEVIIQELSGNGYSIRFSVGRFLKKIKAFGWLHSYGLYSHLMLKNGMHKQIDTIGKLHLRQDQYTCFISESSDCSVVFEKNKEFALFDIFYSPKLLEELAPYFPELKDFVSISPGMVFPGKSRWMLLSMKEIINQLLNCPYDEATRPFYLDLKIRELLYLLIENAFKRNANIRQYTPFEIARIHQARAILESHIDKKPPTIRNLSRLVALNEFKLKNGFKQYFDAGVFEWLMEQKMQHAKTLVLTTNKPIKEISALVGYPRTANFITAFRRRFGMTPGSLQKIPYERLWIGIKQIRKHIPS